MKTVLQSDARDITFRLRPATDEERKQGAPRSVLDADPETAPIATEMFTRVDGGSSIRAVSRWLAPRWRTSAVGGSSACRP